MVAPQDSVSLVQGGPHTGSWESNDVFLNYKYAYQPGTFKLRLGGCAKRGYDQLTIGIHRKEKEDTTDTKIILTGRDGFEICILKRFINRTVYVPLDNRSCFVEFGFGERFNICFPVEILYGSSIPALPYGCGGCKVSHGSYFVDNHADLSIGKGLSKRNKAAKDTPEFAAKQLSGK